MREKFSFSRRTNWPLNVNPLSAALSSLREQNILILDLTESNPTRCGFQYPTEKILSSLAEAQNMIYSPSASGSPEARTAVSQYYRRKGFEVDPKRIFLTASTSEAYSYLFRLLLNPGEGVLVGRPSYPLFEFLVELNDARMETYPLVYEGKWRIDLQALEKAIHPKTRVMILVNPNNPTGSFVTQDELAVIKQLCLKHHIALICDEVFSDYAFQEDSRRVLSLVSTPDVLSFLLGGISKSLGLPQMKCGWIAAGGPAALVNESLASPGVIADTYLSVNTPVQNALSRWLAWQEDISKEIQNRLKQNWELLKKLVRHSEERSDEESHPEEILRFAQNDGKALFRSNPPQVLNCEGGWYAVLKLPSGKHSEEEWAMEFLQKDHVFVHPGYFFDFKEEPFIVLSLLPQPETFKRGVERILRRIKSD